jgi:hypothetical protein
MRVLGRYGPRVVSLNLAFFQGWGMGSEELLKQV